MISWRKVKDADGIADEKTTIHNWETNRTQPEVRLIPYIINFLGYAPYDPGWTFNQKLVAVRSTLGFSQRLFAKKIGLDASTVAKWEIGKHRPLREKLVAVRSFLESLGDDFC
jgi:transcriptional regulator with XRE-family HTH domain